MPFFSFILEKNYSPVSLGAINGNIKILKSKTRYYCKNTSVWKNLNKKNNRHIVKDLRLEKHIKVSNKVKKIIFCLPPSIGVGDAIEYALAIKAIETKKIFEKFGIAFSSRYSSILSQFINLKNIYPDFISEAQVNEYDGLFHFTSEIKELKLQKYQRANIEECIIKYFNVYARNPPLPQAGSSILICSSLFSNCVISSMYSVTNCRGSVEPFFDKYGMMVFLQMYVVI